MNLYKREADEGFTIIELMLSMAFVSMLLLAIAMTVIQIGNTYNRGIIYTSVNTAGGALASELQRSINSSTPFDVTVDASGNGDHYVRKSWGGRLCLGQYSYIWNYGSAIENPLTGLNRYTGSSKTINFIKVLDPSSSYCSTPTGTIDPTGAVEILDVGQSELVIHNFSISSNSYDSHTGQRLYSIGFLIGTNDQQALTGSYENTQCTVGQTNSDPTYCAVNQFDIVARAGNTSG